MLREAHKSKLLYDRVHVYVEILCILVCYGPGSILFQTTVEMKCILCLGQSGERGRGSMQMNEGVWVHVLVLVLLVMEWDVFVEGVGLGMVVVVDGD